MMKRKPLLLAVFAHPDDETFGPGGTLALFSKTHRVVVISVTQGQAGKDSARGEQESLGARRVRELRASTAILGVERVIVLEFRDGTLSNANYHAVARKIERYVRTLKPEILLTFEPRGISGHLDHIAVSMIVHYVFHRTRVAKKMLLYCRKKEGITKQDYFVYRPPGYTAKEIDLVVDTSTVWSVKVRAMHEHRSQMHDVRRLLRRQSRQKKAEYFLVVNR